MPPSTPPEHWPCRQLRIMEMKSFRSSLWSTIKAVNRRLRAKFSTLWEALCNKIRIFIRINDNQIGNMNRIYTLIAVVALSLTAAFSLSARGVILGDEQFSSYLPELQGKKVAVFS